MKKLLALPLMFSMLTFVACENEGMKKTETKVNEEKRDDAARQADDKMQKSAQSAQDAVQSAQKAAQSARDAAKSAQEALKTNP